MRTNERRLSRLENRHAMNAENLPQVICRMDAVTREPLALAWVGAGQPRLVRDADESVAAFHARADRAGFPVDVRQVHHAHP